MADQMTPEMHQAVARSRQAMFEVLKAEFPHQSAALAAVAVAGALVTVLNSPLAAGLAPLIDEQLRGTPYQLTRRAAN